MNVTGIIAEYNPLHNGHIYHIKRTREITNADGIICVMSGNFTQRGIPALFDKWERAKCALENGIDLVIELPTIYSLSSAEFFAHGAVSLLNNLGIVNSLSFGSESGNINTIKKISKLLSCEPKDFKIKLKKGLDIGLSYPSARSNALYELFCNNSSIKDILASSNNILAIEYCKSLFKLKSHISPYTIQREGSNYNSMDLSSSFCSATSLRKHLKDHKSIDILKDKIPKFSLNSIKEAKIKNSLTFEDSMFDFLKFKALTSCGNIKNIPDVSEGLHNKIIKSIHNSNSYCELINNIKSKRYTETRIKRILCQYFIGFDTYVTESLRREPSSYARILGFNSIGREILKIAKHTSSMPIYTKFPKKLNTSLSLDLKSTKAYSLINPSISPFSDYLTSPIIVP